MTEGFAPKSRRLSSAWFAIYELKRFLGALEILLESEELRQQHGQYLGDPNVGARLSEDVGGVCTGPCAWPPRRAPVGCVSGIEARRRQRRRHRMAAAFQRHHAHGKARRADGQEGVLLGAAEAGAGQGRAGVRGGSGGRKEIRGQQARTAPPREPGARHPGGARAPNSRCPTNGLRRAASHFHFEPEIGPRGKRCQGIAQRQPGIRRLYVHDHRVVAVVGKDQFWPFE